MKLSTKNIKSLLRSRGMSPKELAEKLGKTPEAVRLILKNQSTTDSTAEDIADILKVHISEIKGRGEKVEFRPGNSEAILLEMQRDISTSEKKIDILIDHIIKMYRAAGKEDEIKKLEDKLDSL